MKLVCQNTQQELCAEIAVANTFWSRLRGLIGTKNLAARGVYFPQCNWVHTLFMSIPIDVVYVDGSMTVKKIDHDLKPWKIAAPVFSAKDVIELPSGFAKKNDLKVGDTLYVGH